jgi:hypothetical protein
MELSYMTVLTTGSPFTALDRRAAAISFGPLSTQHDGLGRNEACDYCGLHLTTSMRIWNRLATSVLATARWLVPLAMGTLLIVSECEAQQDLVSGTATIRHNPLEGGFFQIEADDRRTYLPTNELPTQFRRSGMRVRFAGRLRPEVMSIYMTGQAIELIQINPE